MAMTYKDLAVAIFVLGTLQYIQSHTYVHARQDDSSAAINAFQLLKEANNVIRPGQSQENTVLLVGNPGAGMTTIGKILTSNLTQLEAYYSDAHQEYLIRDLSNDNNETCQISSQLPEVMTDPENGVTFYKLPSYRGSRCPNKTELGRVLLFRRLPKLTKSVKVLLVADYNSLFFGSEEYFFNLVESALIMFPSLNFNNSIGLVATKVDSNQTDTLIINRLKKFLTGWKDKLSPEATYDDRTERVVSLLASLLQDGQNGQPKIYFTRAPTRPGRLIDLDEMTEMRTKLADLVFRGLESASYSPPDLNYELNNTDMDALESVYNDILKYISRLRDSSESLLRTLYSSEVNYVNHLTPQQMRLIFSSRTAHYLFPDHDEGSGGTKFPFWITAYVIHRWMSELEGVIVPLNSSFTAVRQEFKDRENVLRAVYEILGRLPDDDTLKSILHPEDEAPASRFQPLLDFQRSFCLKPQLNTDPTEACSGQAGEAVSTDQQLLIRRCFLRQTICLVLNEFAPLKYSPATSNFSAGDQLLFNRLMQADKRMKIDGNNKNVVLLIGPDSVDKAAVGKLLTTDAAQLESYHNDEQGKYLIRDLNTTVTVRAHSICQIPISPHQLMRDSENNLTFYELPNVGQADCPNSMELEHLLHVRRLVKHADSVKILFIVDSDSILGVSNATFYNWIHSAASLFTSIDKLNNSIGLVVTGVDTEDPYVGVSISGFLTDLATELDEDEDEMDSTPSNGSRAAKTVSLLDILLLGEGPNGERKFNFTRALTRPGRLSELPEMMEARTKLADLVYNNLNGTNLRASELNISLPQRDRTALVSLLESIYNFTAFQMTSTLNTLSSEHKCDQLPPAKQIILHEFKLDFDLVKSYKRTMNGTDKVPFITMSNFLKSSIKVARHVFVPYNSSSSTGLPEQLLELERGLRLVHEIVGTLGG